MTIKRFHPLQVIHVPGALGLYRAESFAVGEQGCVSIDVPHGRTCVNVGLEVSGKRLIVQYSPIGVLVHDPHEQLPFADALLAMAPEVEVPASLSGFRTHGAEEWVPTGPDKTFTELASEREVTKRPGARKTGKP